MLAPHGVKPSEVDYVFAGATSARLSALQSGAVDAAILTSPHNFYAESAGFTNLGWTIDYAKELPFSGGAVNRAWAAANKPTLDKFLAAYTKCVLWFQDRANRAEAVKIMAEISKLNRLCQESRDAGAQGRVDHASIGGAAEHDDRHVNSAGAQRPGQTNAIHPRHIQV